jgi:hypothetical protein
MQNEKLVEVKSDTQKGGLLSNPYGMPNQQMEEEENLIEQSMLGANQMPSLMGGRR